MAILPGSRLGPYEVLSSVGAGGMGEVYRARDTRLNRTVAIKVLPEQFSGQSESRERFEREAKTIASLNHPHICTLYDVGREGGTDYLVMEYIEGETLAQRLAKGPLPLQQVLQYAVEIADALDKAHRKGITHRDLKPGNIMLTKSGTKLLDFGLAKLAQDAAPVTPESQLATMKDGITAQGTILGTLQYMAPEQVEGKEVDARTDIFAFGVVVYEMATGKKAFEGKSQASLMAKILETDPPPMASITPMTPPALDRVVKRCLAKDMDERCQNAKDLTDELKWIAEQGHGPEASLPAPPAASRGARNRLPWLIAGIGFFVAAAMLAAVLYLRRPVPEARAFRFTVAPPEKQSLPDLANAVQSLSVSPDGSKLTFVAVDAAARSALWVRDLDSQSAKLLPGTDDAWAPFWSPDSRYIAFHTGSALKKVPVSGGPVETITASTASLKGSWNEEGVVLFSPGPGGPLFRVSATGGPATPVTTIDASQQQVDHYYPSFLPDGKHFLYTARGSSAGGSGIYVGSLNSKETKLLLNTNSAALYSPPGYLLYVRAGTLLAQPFDAQLLDLKGDPVPVAQGVQFYPSDGGSSFDVSQNGVLAYRLVPTNAQFRLSWLDRKGTEQPLTAPPHNYRNPRLSPDGQHVAVTIDESGSQEWLLDIGRGTLTKLTFEGNYNGGMAWTPDGKRLAFGSDRAGPRNLFWQQADGSGAAERLVTVGQGVQVASSWSPDGQLLAFEQTGQGTGYDIWILRVADRSVQPFLKTPFNEIAPRFSPDGRWLAYASDESGRFEIYVQPYPGPGGKLQISTDGGTEPVWARNGELFYRSGEKMMVVETTTFPNFSASNPKELFEGHFAPYQTVPSFDVTPDGQRFLVTNAAEAARAEITVVVNWPEELKRESAAGKQ